jgi:hypothetical protein
VLQVLTDKDAAGAADLVAQRDADKDLFETTFPLSAELQAYGDKFKPGETTRYVFIEARADSHATRNQSHIAAVMDLHNDQGTEVVQPMAWYDRAPWAEPAAAPHDAGEGQGK